MVDAIKINYLNFSEGSIKPKYYVFSEHTEDISEIFDSKELKYIGKNKVPVQFIKKSIHLDDTIDIIDIQVKELNEIKGKFIEIHQLHELIVDDIIKYYGQNNLDHISNKKRVLNLLKSDNSD